MIQDVTSEAEWVNLTQAARRLGWPRERLRSAARRGRVQAKRGANSGELLILITPELLAQCQPHEAHGPAHRPTSQVAKEADKLVALEAALDDAEAQVADLRAELARAQAERDAAVRTGEAEVRLLREMLDRERAVSGELRAALDRPSLLERLVRAFRRPLAHDRPSSGVREGSGTEVA